MAAKDVRFSSDARERMLRGVNTRADAVRVTLENLTSSAASVEWAFRAKSRVEPRDWVLTSPEGETTSLALTLREC